MPFMHIILNSMKFLTWFSYTKGEYKCCQIGQCFGSISNQPQNKEAKLGHGGKIPMAHPIFAPFASCSHLPISIGYSSNHKLKMDIYIYIYTLLFSIFSIHIHINIDLEYPSCFEVWTSGPLHTRDWEPVTIILQVLSLVEKAEPVQVCYGVSMWMQDGCVVYMDSYMTSNGSCFMVTWIIFKNHLLEGGLTQNRETMALWRVVRDVFGHNRLRS